MNEIDFEADDFRDILERDQRFHPYAYALLMDVVHYLSTDGERHVSGEEVLDEFKERTLDQFGPMSYTVLTEWGVTCTEDIGEMMFNLVEGNRVRKDDEDSAEAFVGGYDFKEIFLGPYQA